MKFFPQIPFLCRGASRCPAFLCFHLQDQNRYVKGILSSRCVRVKLEQADSQIALPRGRFMEFLSLFTAVKCLESVLALV